MSAHCIGGFARVFRAIPAFPQLRFARSYAPSSLYGLAYTRNAFTRSISYRVRIGAYCGCSLSGTCSGEEGYVPRLNNMHRHLLYSIVSRRTPDLPKRRQASSVYEV